MSDFEETPKYLEKYIKSKYKGRGLGNFTKTDFTEIFADIDERLKDIEHKVNANSKKIISTRAQQMLLLHHLGFLEKLNDFDLSNKKKAKLLSVLLNASPSNIEGDLSDILNPKSKLKKSDNYQVLIETFKRSGIKELEEECQAILEAIEKSKRK
ncbi:MAG: hypothetical protein ACTHM7_08195 [Ginsengibacter sp.]